jgi:3-hydroxymyristoyl/3-hydroxydecanoyl-(acyl carrier protein) dehydratase
MTPPYRLVTHLSRCDGLRAEASWRPHGGELGAAQQRDRPAEVPGALVLEALTQCAGLMLCRDEPDGAMWMLSGVDGARFGPVPWGEDVGLGCVLVRRSGPAAVVDARATVAAGPACEARLLLVRRA